MGINVAILRLESNLERQSDTSMANNSRTRRPGGCEMDPALAPVVTRALSLMAPIEPLAALQLRVEDVLPMNPRWSARQRLDLLGVHFHLLLRNSRGAPFDGSEPREGGLVMDLA